MRPSRVATALTCTPSNVMEQMARGEDSPAATLLETAAPGSEYERVCFLK